jgi:flavin reductase (DIM6/NTAB) family NADH-FMN oxidoreductase RutF
MDTANHSDSKRALSSLQRGVFVLTAKFENKRAGVLIRSVQQVAEEPPLICVAVRRGHWIDHIIRDSHAFAVCRISPEERLMVRKFDQSARQRDGDQFDCVPVSRLVTGAPIIARSMLALDCEVFRHLDLEADHELYIGLVVGTQTAHQDKPEDRGGAGPPPARDIEPREGA